MTCHSLHMQQWKKHATVTRKKKVANERLQTLLELLSQSTNMINDVTFMHSQIFLQITRMKNI